MNPNDIQYELEAEMVSLGAERYRNELDRGLSTVGPGKALMRRAVKPMAEAIEQYYAIGKGRTAGMKYIRDVDAYILADLTLRRALDCAIKEETLTKTSKAIASAVEWHIKDAALANASMSIWNKTQERLRRTPDPTYRRKAIDGSVRGWQRWAAENAPELADALTPVKGPAWDIQQKVAVGTALIDMFARSTGLIETHEERTGKTQSKVIVRLTEKTEAWLHEQNLYYQCLRPVHLPMVVPPKDWTGPDSGGYLDNSKAGVRFLKSRAVKLEFCETSLQDAYDGVNLIQRTPWRVNMAVWEVMKQVWETGSRIGGVPPRVPEKQPIPPLPKHLADMTPEGRRQHKDYKDWATVASSIHESRALDLNESRTFGALMGVADRFVAYPVFYHPHKLDWRQRAYPISMFLSPQGDQFNKGLIEFAEGKRMGDSENAAAWLAIHGANCYGIDKVSFEERIEWVRTFEASILESALFPFETAFWQQADKPWPFLAFCFEWLGYRIAGDDFETHLPVALDGANSGLQHLSAMLRDPEGARVTCVQPGPQPEDVYQMVADAVEAEIQSRRNALEHENYQWNDIWAGKVTRKIVKQPTMTYTYSATESGMRNQIAAALHGLDRECDREVRGSTYLDYPEGLMYHEKAAADFLAPIVRSAIKTQMVKAAEAMDFLIETCRVYSQTGLPIRWSTPLGIPVAQYYPQSTVKLQQVFINGQRHRLKLLVDAPDRLNKKRAAAGVSPNFVHSMDSTHLLWTVLNCNDEYGLTDFAMIHDSFGTHATACDELAYATRAMFVALYDEDRLANFREGIVETLKTLGRDDLIEELPPTPTFGTFDIERVMDSDYFFA